MCILVEEEEDVIFCEVRVILEKVVDLKMFMCLKLLGFGFEDNCYGMIFQIIYIMIKLLKYKFFCCDFYLF